MSKISMYTQYEAAKHKHPNHIVLMQVGKMYESLELDAYIVRKILGFTMSHRKKSGSYIPMTGTPDNNLKDHIKTLTDAGINVVLVVQLETLTETGIKERKVKDVFEAKEPVKIHQKYEAAYVDYLNKHFIEIKEKQASLDRIKHDSRIETKLLDELKKVNVDKMKPFDALKLLADWQKKYLFTIPSNPES